MSRAFAARDFEAVMRCYADDAVLLAPGRPAAVGKAAIAAELRAAFDLPADAAVLVFEVDAAGGGLAQGRRPGDGLLSIDGERILSVRDFLGKLMAVAGTDEEEQLHASELTFSSWSTGQGRHWLRVTRRLRTEVQAALDALPR